MRLGFWIAIGIVTLAASGCATRTQAPVADRQASRPATTSPAVAKAAEAGASVYVVKQGDTLYSIAVAHSMDPRELAALNDIGDASKIQVGQVLRLRAAAPAPVVETGTVTVTPVTGAAPIEGRPLGAAAGTAPGATTPAAAPPAAPAPGSTTAGGPPKPVTVVSGLKTAPKMVKLPYSDQNLALLQRGEETPAAMPSAPAAPAAAPAPKTAAATGEDAVDWGWPAKGAVTGTFQENGSKGLSIGGKLGDPVYASAAGSVVYQGDYLNYGKLIILKHNDKYLSVYAHNSKILVKENQTVAKGQKIAEVGATGAAGERPGLHFEIRRFGKPVDPQQFLPARP